MTVSNLVKALESAKQKWQTNVVQARPGEEGQLQSHLGRAVTYASVTQRFDNWIAALRLLSSKPRVSASISRPLIEATELSLASVSTAIDHAGNGVDWICSNRHFALGLTTLGPLIREITSESGRETIAIVNAANQRLTSDLDSLQKGGKVASELLDKNEALNEQIETIETASEVVEKQVESITASVDSASEKINELVAEIGELSTTNTQLISDAHEEYKELLSSAKQSLSEADLLRKKAQELVDSATKAGVEASAKLGLAEIDLVDATARQNASQERLTKALQSAQMEGLAGSFTRKADEAQAEIIKEQKRFEWALIYLAAVGVTGLIIELTTGFPRTTEEFSFRLIRTLSLAAPGIWVAWTAARKLSALNRVFSDYQYKSASALAYESYRQTVAEAGDDDLKKQLLAFAIRSFGENPTRYYDSARDDPTSPGESWLAHIFSWKKST